MGQRAAGALLLALLLHGRLLAVSVGGRGRGVGGGGRERPGPRSLRQPTWLGLWPGKGAPARDPGRAQAGATLHRGVVPKGARGNLRGAGGGAA